MYNTEERPLPRPRPEAWSRPLTRLAPEKQVPIPQPRKVPTRLPKLVEASLPRPLVESDNALLRWRMPVEKPVPPPTKVQKPVPPRVRTPEITTLWVNPQYTSTLKPVPPPTQSLGTTLPKKPPRASLQKLMATCVEKAAPPKVGETSWQKPVATDGPKPGPSNWARPVRLFYPKPPHRSVTRLRRL